VDPVISLIELPDAPLFVCPAAVAVAVVVFVLIPVAEPDCVVVVGTITRVCPSLVLRLRLGVALLPYRQPDIPRTFPQALLYHEYKFHSVSP
jgi:hypothetical protein